MEMKKLTALSLALSLTLLTACENGNSADSSSASPETSSAAVTEAPESKEEKLPETDEEWDEAMINTAMTSYGNTKMVQDVIKKAQNGEEVTLAYLGGSITEGISAGADLCYAKLSYEHFAEKFGTGDNVKYVNAGISGTPSKLGILRLDRDVLNYDPDLVFIEFAVNDGNEADFQNAYESIVKTLLQKNVAVVLLFSVTENDHSAQDYMKQIGEAYRLPMISYCDALRFMFTNGRMTWKDFSNDQSHPNTEGHALVARMIDHYWDTVMEVEPEGEPMMPFEDVFHPREVDAKMAENNGITPVEMGSWVEGSDVAHFTNGWSHDPDLGNDPLVFEVEPKFLYLIYKEVKGGNYGDLHVHITQDGAEYADRNVTVISPEGWGNPQLTNIIMEPSPAKYRVEISMADGDEDKQGQVLALGWTE